MWKCAKIINTKCVCCCTVSSKTTKRIVLSHLGKKKRVREWECVLASTAHEYSADISILHTYLSARVFTLATYVYFCYLCGFQCFKRLWHICMHAYIYIIWVRKKLIGLYWNVDNTNKRKILAFTFFTSGCDPNWYILATSHFVTDFPETFFSLFAFWWLLFVGLWKKCRF